MGQFSPVDAAMEGFRLTRENPLAVAIWAGFQFVFSLGAMAVFLTLGGSSFQELSRMSQDAAAMQDPERVMRLFSGMAAEILPLLALVIPLSIIYSAVQRSAVMRAVLRPEQRGFGFLRLSMDEFRVGIVLVAIGLIMGVGIAIGYFVIAILVVVFIALKIVALAVLFGVLGGIALVCGMVFFGVRFALAVPQTFAEGRIAIFDSWSLTRGHFWRMFGCFLLAFLLYLVVATIGGIINFVVTLVGMTAGLGPAAAEPDFSNPMAFFTAVQVFSMLVSSVISALGIAIMLAPLAVAYRQISGRADVDAF